MHDHFSVVKAGLDLGVVGYVVSTWYTDHQNTIATTMTIIWLSYCLIEASMSIYKRIKARREKD